MNGVRIFVPITHITAFKYNPLSTPEDRNSFEHDFIGQEHTCLRDGTPYLISIKRIPLTNDKPDLPSCEGMDVIFHVLFATQADVEYHLEIDPEHTRIKEKYLGGVLADLVVWDLSALE